MSATQTVTPAPRPTHDVAPRQQKAYRGLAMEGGVARWYAKNTRGRRDYDRVAAMLAPLIPDYGSFLEVAPGPGYHTVELARLVPNAEAHGLDISASFVAIAAANARDAGVPVDFRLGNASQMPFDDAVFDLVVCQAAFKNFTEPVRALAEMRRVLKPAAVGLVEDLRRDSSLAGIRREVDAMGMSPANAWLTRLTFRYVLRKNAYTAEEMRAMAAAAGFSNVRVDLSAIGMAVWLGDEASRFATRTGDRA